MSFSITIYPTDWHKPIPQALIHRAEDCARRLGYDVHYEFLGWGGWNILDKIGPSQQAPLVGFGLTNIATDTLLGNIDFFCSWIDNDVPHPPPRKELELWGEEFTGHPVLELEDSASASLIDKAQWVPYYFHFEGIRIAAGAYGIACCVLIAAVADWCGGIIYSNDGALPPEANGLQSEEFLIWCKERFASRL